MPDPSQVPTAVAALQTRTLVELEACERFVTDTRRAWRLVQQLAVAVPPAGSEPTADLVELAGKAQAYVSIDLAEATFQQSLAIFEAFLADLLALWHTTYPQALGQRQVLLADILAGDRDTVIAGKVAEVVSDVMHGPPAKWFEWLGQHTRLGRPTDEQIARFTEAKASRDLLAHNRGVANKTYLTKAGVKLARYPEGRRIEVPEPYRREVWELLGQMTQTICGPIVAKAAPDLPPPPAAG